MTAANWMDPDDEHYVVTAIGWHVLNFPIYLGVSTGRTSADCRCAAHPCLGVTRPAEASTTQEEADAQFATLEERLANFERSQRHDGQGRS